MIPLKEAASPFRNFLPWSFAALTFEPQTVESYNVQVTFFLFWDLNSLDKRCYERLKSFGAQGVTVKSLPKWVRPPLAVSSILIQVLKITMIQSQAWVLETSILWSYAVLSLQI